MARGAFGNQGWSRDKDIKDAKGGWWSRVAGRSANDRLFTDATIDKLLRAGRTPGQIKTMLGKEMGGLTGGQKAKINRRVDTRAAKHGQGRKGK